VSAHPSRVVRYIPPRKPAVRVPPARRAPPPLAPITRAELAAEAQRISAVRMHMLERHPFWGFLLMNVRLSADPTLPAIAATDCVRHIWYDPRRTRALDFRSLGFVLAHELGHHVYATAARAKGRNHHLWNIATDYAINRIVSCIVDPVTGDAAYRPLPDILLHSRFDGMTAEQIYEALQEDPVGVLLMRVHPDPKEVDAAGQRTSDHGGGLDVHLPAELDDAAREELAKRLRSAVAHAAAQGAAGQVPGEFARLVGAGRSTVPWQRLFRRLVASSTTRDEYDPRRPHPRWAGEGFVVPSLSGERCGRVVVALDTSGSMSPESLATACAEIRGLAQQVEDLTVLVADARVQEVVELDALERWLKRGRARGGGGTDHRPVFEWIARSGRPPELFVGLTDLRSQFPERTPPFPVVWIVPEIHRDAPFGRVIVVPDAP
jgi:predicted metal-dependent peptidase